MASSLYVAVILLESRSTAPTYSPLIEERFVIIGADSLEEAAEKAEVRVHAAALTYENVYNQTVSWSPKLVSVGEALAASLEDGAEVYSRFFRNLAAYEQLGFESFSEDHLPAETCDEGT